MWGKTHSPEAVRKIKEANVGHTGEANSNARLCQILSLDYVVLFEFRTVIDLTKKYIQLHQEEFNQTYTFSTARTYIDRVKNTDKTLDEKYYIRIFRKNQDNTVPSSSGEG